MEVCCVCMWALPPLPSLFSHGSARVPSLPLHPTTVAPVTVSDHFSLEVCSILTLPLLSAGKHAVVLVAGDAVASQPTAEFLERANASVAINDADIRPPGGAAPGGGRAAAAAAAAVPAGYDRVARWHMERYGTTREQLAMAACLMSLQGSRHPDALSRRCGAVRQGCNLGSVPLCWKGDMFLLSLQ